MIYYHKDKKGLASLIGLLLAAVIIAFLIYIMMNKKMGSAVDNKTKKTLEEQGVDTSSYKGILDTTKKKIKDINRQIIDRTNQ